MKLYMRFFQRKRNAGKAVGEKTYYKHSEHRHQGQPSAQNTSRSTQHQFLAKSATTNSQVQTWRRNDERRIHSLQSQQPQEDSCVAAVTLFNGADSTPKGYNKTLRDSARLFLAAYSTCMLYGAPYWALLWSTLSCIFLYHGTFWSARNMLWGILCWTSLPFALLAATLHGIQAAILEMTTMQDNTEQPTYSSTYIFFFSFERLLEISTGFFCGFILFLTFLGKLEREITRD